jgi:hypothetical protein
VEAPQQEKALLEAQKAEIYAQTSLLEASNPKQDETDGGSE